MTISKLIDALQLTIFNLNEPDREVFTGYCGDLLSWVMGRAPEDSAWITIMSNRNLVAVASMANVSCIILSESVVPDDDMLEKAKDEGINILGSKLGTYEIAAELSKLL